jgi:hypothetical protein
VYGPGITDGNVINGQIIQHRATPTASNEGAGGSAKSGAKNSRGSSPLQRANESRYLEPDSHDKDRDQNVGGVLGSIESGNSSDSRLTDSGRGLGGRGADRMIARAEREAEREKQRQADGMLGANNRALAESPARRSQWVQMRGFIPLWIGTMGEGKTERTNL